MKKTLAVLSVLAMTLPAAARELGDINDWRHEMREVRVPEARSAPVVHAPTDAAGCSLLKLDDVVISRGVFSNDFTVEANGVEVGQIELGDSIVIKDGSAIAAQASGGTVTDCSGKVIGTVTEAAGEDASSFVIQNAAGEVVAQSGSVDGHSMVLKGTGGMVSVQNNHWFKDSYKVSVSGVDARLAAVAVIMNNRALYRRAAQRRRDNPREPHGGRDR